MKINISKLMVLGLMCCTSCDYLDVVPKGKFVVETAEEYLQMVESPSPNYDIDLFGYVANEKGRMRIQEVTGYELPHVSAAILWDETVDRIQYMEKEDELYNSAYNRIAKYNIIIDGMPGATGSEQVKILGTAQAKILRAYNHFFLVNTYAKMYDSATAATDPGIVVQEDFNMEVKKKQSSVAEVYESIERDIIAALPNLPDSPKDVFLPGKAFGYALQAKVALFKRNPDAALTAALQALNYGHELFDLVALYNTMPFMPWMLSYPRENSEAILHQFARADNSTMMQIINPETAKKFGVGDCRLDVFFAQNPPMRPTAEPGSRMFTNMMMASFYNPSGIRLSEVYLMIAECYARKDDYTNAMKYLNDVRVKRIRPPFYAALSASNREEAMRFIREERDMELVLTCNKFFDMRRFMAEDGTPLHKTFDGKEYTLNPDSHLLIFPFSQQAIQGNPNLKQNSK